MKTYSDLKKEISTELNDFKGIFFAFNNQQLNKILSENNITINDLVSIGSGGLLLKTKKKDWISMMDKHNIQMEMALKDKNFLLDALTYELSNHEYCITYDPQDALDSLGLDSETVNADILKKACLIASQSGGF